MAAAAAPAPISSSSPVVCPGTASSSRPSTSSAAALETGVSEDKKMLSNMDRKGEGEVEVDGKAEGEGEGEEGLAMEIGGQDKKGVVERYDDAGEDEGAGGETDSVGYGDVDSDTTMREGVQDGSVSPSYSSLRVELDLEDSQSLLPLEEIFEGDASGSELEGGLADTSEPFEYSELELIEHALQTLRSLHTHKHLRASADDGPDSGEGEAERQGVDESSPSSPLASRDVNLVSRLLKKVQAVREQTRESLRSGARSIPVENRRSLRQGLQSASNGDEDMDFSDMLQVAQAASKAAFAAAKAAEAVVSSVDRNSQAIQELCRSFSGTNTTEVRMNGVGKKEPEITYQSGQLEELRRTELDIEMRQEKVSKNLQRQNFITHCVLGFIVVSSFVWRFGVVKFVKRVNNTIQSPIHQITGVFDNFKGPDDKAGGKKKQSKQGSKGPGLNLPSILGSNSDESRRHASEADHKGFDLGQILPHKEADDSEEKDAEHFNLGKLLPRIESKTVQGPAAGVKDDSLFDKVNLLLPSSKESNDRD